MSRPLRIQYPDAWYHVMNRGRRGEVIFSKRLDYYLFADLLKDVVDLYNVRIVAYCLMPNHHLLVQTPDANLSRSMMKKVGEEFGILKYSTISSIVERVKHEVKTDKVFRKRIQDLIDKISKSQRQI